MLKMAAGIILGAAAFFSGAAIMDVVDRHSRPEACACDPCRCDSQSAVLRQSISASARIVAGEYTGSGVCVFSDGDEAYVLTAKHVVDGCSGVLVQMAEGEHYRASVYAVDHSADLAVVSFRLAGRESITSVRVACERPIPGSKLFQVGFPSGGRHTLRLSWGVHSRSLPGPGLPNHDGRLFFYTMELLPGDSGSGVFDSSGSLVSVVCGANCTRDFEFNFGVDTLNIIDFLDFLGLR